MNALDDHLSIVARSKAQDRKVVRSLIVAIVLLSSLIGYWHVTESARQTAAIAYLAEH